MQDIQTEADQSNLPSEQPQPNAAQEKKFHGWRLLGVIAALFVILAVVSGFIDYLVIGPLDGRI
jgi:hypothetical protein